MVLNSATLVVSSPPSKVVHYIHDDDDDSSFWSDATTVAQGNITRRVSLTPTKAMATVNAQEVPADVAAANLVEATRLAEQMMESLDTLNLSAGDVRVLTTNFKLFIQRDMALDALQHLFSYWKNLTDVTKTTWLNNLRLVRNMDDVSKQAFMKILDQEVDLLSKNQEPQGVDSISSLSSTHGHGVRQDFFFSPIRCITNNVVGFFQSLVDADTDTDTDTESRTYPPPDGVMIALDVDRTPRTIGDILTKGIAQFFLGVLRYLGIGQTNAMIKDDVQRSRPPKPCR